MPRLRRIYTHRRRREDPSQREAFGEAALAAEMIHLAIDQMREPMKRSWLEFMRKGVDRDATLWLASAAAAPWFDLAGVDQRAALEALNWPKYARRLLKRRDLKAEERSYIRSVLAKLEA